MDGQPTRTARREAPACSLPRLTKGEEHARNDGFDVLHASIACGTFLGCQHPLQNVIANPQRIGDDRQAGIHGATGGEEAAVDDIKIVDVVGFAVDIQRAGERVIVRSARCRSGERRLLMGSAGR